MKSPLPHRQLLLLSLLLCFLARATQPCAAADTYRIVHVYPHDPQAFTQGLIYMDGHLYESTGLNGRSTLRMDDLESGRVLQSVPVPAQYFAEGLTEWGSTLIQLTWQAHIGFVYDRFSFRQLRTFNYSGEGWGLTHDAKNLILSDGTATLRFLDPKTFREVRHIVVNDHGSPVTQLNELEFVHGQIYANVWLTDRIVRISPVTGKVLGSIDLSGLLPASERDEEHGAVLNGIAWDAAGDRLFVTGKLWPKLFEIKIVPETAKPIPAHGSR
jgi:glutamine cyclotransferase